ncbi:hypothetical protein JTE90_009106 [Oedothorax gibbosus]|uniref:Anion exchange protein n=2 Tax=Oedothorax gibbosus TaxID=931172 RepID=A0AAV6UF40_9ARAC|nr:hypothetical protein JTE90_009106 [Oedothorax gibbosus]
MKQVDNSNSMDRRKSIEDKVRKKETEEEEQRRLSEEQAKAELEERSWEDQHLDEEMEEIFHPASDQFCLADLTSGEIKGSPHFTENDYEMHRRESFQCHQPLRKLYHKHRKNKKRHAAAKEDRHRAMARVLEESSPRDEPSEEEPMLSPLSPIEGAAKTDSTAKDVLVSVPQQSNDDAVQFFIGSTSSLETGGDAKSKQAGPLKSVLRSLLPTVSLSPSGDSTGLDSTLHSSLTDSELTKTQEESSPSVPVDLKHKVKFMLGKESREDMRRDSQESPKTNKHKSHRRHSAGRKHHGFNIDVKNYTTVFEPEEAETLQSVDIDDMASHRFEDPKGMRRHKIKKPSIASFFKKKDEQDSSFIKKTFDHSPHELFVELHELKEYELDSLEWRQTARWIKYEEDVELGPDKWGKPHVPPLSFHSLLKLRQCLDSGGVLLDLEENDLVGISKRIVECMVNTDQIKTEQKDTVLRALMLRHRHVNEKMHPNMRRNSSGYGNLNMLSHDKNSRSPLFLKSGKQKSETEIVTSQNHDETSLPQETVILMPDNNNTSPSIDFTPVAKRKSISYDKSIEQGIHRRVPENAEGAAVLVGKLDGLDNPATVFIRLAEGKQMAYFLEIPIAVRFLFVLLGPAHSTLDYHEVGRAIGALMSNADFHNSAYKAYNRKDLLHAINNFLDTSTVVPPGKWERQSLLPIDEIRRKSLVPPRRVKGEPIIKEEPSYDPLKRTGRVFGGFIQDIKNRYPRYLSDITDGFTFQCVASVIFIYFAAISGAVAFGGLLMDKTGKQIGVSETLIGTCISGIIFALFSGQPLIIIGTTAPLVLVDETIYKLRNNFESDFLVMRCWVGIWTAVIAISVVAAEGSVLVKFFSRFVQEIFATIIALLFIIDALTKLYSIFVENPLLPTYCDGTNLTSYNSTNATMSELPIPHPNTALLSTILMIGTFYIAFFLRHFRNSKFLGRSARRALGDFGVPIALVLMKLSVPEGFSPSIDRTWIVTPFPVSVMDVAIAFVGGVLVFILVFMETQICELIISKKKLKKGSGFHIDLFMIGCLAMISGFIGGPWQCAATVRSISHTSSLIVWSKTHAPGETPHIVEVKEQRLTSFLVSVLVGVSIFLSPLLRQVPLAALFGVFLYMGISSLSGIHLYERFLLIFMPTKHHPDFNFVRKVRTSKMHLYTLIQVFCIGVLWVIKMFATIAFPFGLLSMILVHSQIKRLFTKEEVQALDEEGEGEKEDDEEPDFYEQIVA